MSANSKIEWTQATWNPIAGCTILTPGCTNCYAMKMAARLEAMGQELYAGLTKPSKAGAVWSGIVRRAPESVLLAPLKRKKPTTYFVNSMSDLFHESVPDEWIDQIFDVMERTERHTYQVLTKRAKRMRDYIAHRFNEHDGIPHSKRSHSSWRAALSNVWLGVSAERQQEADERIPLLLQTPAAVRFVSCEPLLGPIDLTKIELQVASAMNPFLDATRGEYWTTCLRRISRAEAHLDWVIVGGESGSKARPMHPDWARSLRNQCVAVGVPFFFKQWGEWAPDTGPGKDSDPIFEGKGLCAKLAERGWEFSENGFTMPLGGDGKWLYRLGKKAAGRLLDGVEHNEMPAN